MTSLASSPLVPGMTPVLVLFTVQAALGAFDNLWHHELEADLRHQPTARLEIALHAGRELLYAVLFASIGWWRWEGALAWCLVGVLAVEMGITLWDFVEEDRSRRLPAFERVLHTVLAVNYGVLLALWAPHIWQWAQRPSGFAPVDYGAWSWLMTLFGAGVLAWGVMDAVAARRLAVPAWRRAPLVVGAETALSRRVLVTGGTGFIGRALVRRLVARGDRVTVLTRRRARALDLFGPWVEAVESLDEIAAPRRLDAVVNLAGEPLAGGLWTARRRQRFLSSRLDVTRRVGGLIRRLESPPRVLLSASAIGWYGARGDEELTEHSVPGTGFLAELCQQWEDAAEACARPGLRVCRLRFGLVLGRSGGVLAPLARASRLGLGAVLGDGRQWQSWIHLEDLLRLIEFALDEPGLSGPVNAVAAEPARQRDFARALGAVLRRPVWLGVPAGWLRRGLGEMSALFLVSQRVLPREAVDAGFRFRWPYLDAALRDLCDRPALPAPGAAPAAG